MTDFPTLPYSWTCEIPILLIIYLKPEKGNPFRTVPPRIGCYKEYPLPPEGWGGGGELRILLASNHFLCDEDVPRLIKREVKGGSMLIFSFCAVIELPSPSLLHFLPFLWVKVRYNKPYMICCWTKFTWCLWGLPYEKVGDACLGRYNSRILIFNSNN